MSLKLLCFFVIFSKIWVLIFSLNRNLVNDRFNKDEVFLTTQNQIELISGDLNETVNHFNTINNFYSTSKSSKIHDNPINIVKNEEIDNDDLHIILEANELILFERTKKSTVSVNNYEDVKKRFNDVDGSGDEENELLIKDSNYKLTNFQPGPGQRSLVIVFDGTASMTDDLDQLRNGAEYIIEKLTARYDNPIYNYVFVPFRDPDVGPKLVTTNYKKLLHELKTLKLRGGGDCPEHALGGIMSALESALPKSFIYVFTDAVASDYYLQDEVLQLIQKKQTPITFFITGYCKLENSSEHLAFQKIARASNGQIFDLKKNDIKQVIESMELLLNVNRIPVKYIDSTTNDTHSIDLDVDKNLKEFTVSVAGSEPNITVKNPKNETINNSADILNLENLKIVKIREPEIGTWNIQAGSTSPHSIHLSGISEVTFDYGFTTNEEPATFQDISHKPKANLRHVLSIIPSEPSLIEKLTTITLKLFNEDNDRERFKFNLPLKKIEIDRKEVYVTIPIPLPRQLFKISITGKDTKGNPFERLLSTAINTDIASEEPEVYMDIDTYESLEGNSIVLKCKVDSIVPVSMKWMRNSRILKHLKTSQQQHEFNYQIDRADISDSGRYTCEAENEAGVNFKTATVKVLEKKLTVFTPSKNVLTVEGDTNIELECNINLIEGVDVYWILNGQEILFDTNYELLDNSNLLIKFLKRNINGTFKCFGRYREQLKYDFIQLDVKYPVETDEKLNENITVRYGDAIDITCNGRGNPKPNITWIITLFDKSVKYLNNEKSIYIENMTVSNEGSYMCKMYNGIGDSILRVVNLDGGPDKDPLNIIKASQDDKIILANENDNVNISCQCINCSPLLSFNWVQPNNNSLLYNNLKLRSYTNYELTPKGFIKRFNNNLFIKNIKMNQAGNYVCELQNANGFDQMTYRIVVLPINPIIKLNEGNMFTIKCDLSNDGGADIIEWRKDGEVILHDNNNKHLILDNDNRSLAVNEVYFSDAGIYSCKSIGLNGSMVKNFTLFILVPKVQSIQTAVVGDRVILPCKLRQLNSPEVTWRLNGRDIHLHTNDHDIGKYKQINNSLMFKADFADTGIYQCELINQTDYTVEEEELVLVIYSSPYIYPAHDEIVEVTSNSDILLQCTSKGIPIPIITWYFDNHIVENSSLLIGNISKRNEGPYICNAFNGIGTQQKVFHIVVFDKPKIISNVPDSLRITSDISHNITCDAIGNPEPIVYWIEIQNSNITESNVDLRSQIINNTFLINSSTKSGLYSCIAENKLGMDTKYMSVEIVKRPRIKRNDTNQIYFNSMQVLIKDSAQIVCPIENYNSVVWYKNERPLNLRSGSLQLQNNNLSIIIPSVSSHNDGNYTCIAESIDGTLNYTIGFHVLEPPIYLQSELLNSDYPENFTSLSDFELVHEIKIKAGDQFIINCSSKGKPEPQYFWKKNGNIIVNSSLLKISDLTLNDSGIYTCTAENIYGDIQQSYELIVISEPKSRIIDDDEEYITVGTRETVKLNCNMVGYPEPEIVWYKNGKPIDGEYQEIMEIWYSNINDNGEYKCLAENEHGSNEKTFYLNVLDPPSINFISSGVSTVKPDGFNITCTASGIPIPILTWTYNGRVLTTTSRIPNIDLKKLMQVNESFVNTEFYVDQHGNEFSKNNRIPFDQVKIKNSNTFRHYGIARLVNKIEISLELIFPKSRSEYFGKYDCIAINSNGRDNKSVSVDVIIPPYNPYKKDETVELQNIVIETLAGLPILLICPFIGKPTPEYYWYKDNQRMIIDSENTKLENAGQQLTITKSTEGDNGIYNCLARNVGGTIAHNFSVTILVPPTFFNTIQSINDNNLDDYDFNGNEVGEVVVKLNLGDTLSLECPVYAIPKPQIYWYKLIYRHGPPLLNNNPIKILQTMNSNLSIPSIKESAIYVCSANNSIGTVDKIFHVFVESPPILNGTDSEENEIAKTFEVAAQIYHGFTLECNIIGSPEPKIRWLKNKIEVKNGFDPNDSLTDETIEDPNNNDEVYDSDYESDDNEVVTEHINKNRKRKTINENGIFISKDRRVLRIISSSKDDSGIYSCSGSNKHGIAEQIFNVKINVPVEYSPWGTWTTCSTTCGKGIRKRYRTCLLPNGDAATELDNKCFGIDTQIQNCEDSPCPINGGWSEWSPWSPCTSSCINDARGINSIRRRYRKCDAPTAERGGRPCLGSSAQIEQCSVSNCPIDGAWTVWSEWSLCSATCGKGVIKRHRSCTNPKPMHNGRQCTGQDYEVKECFESKCSIDGGWSNWGAWSHCSKPCGQGSFKQRNRLCNSPEPEFGGNYCSGGNIEISPCPIIDCSIKHSPINSKSSQKLFTPLLSFDTRPLLIHSIPSEKLIRSTPKYSESRIPPIEYAAPKFKESQISLKVESFIPIQSNFQEMNINIPIIGRRDVIIIPENLHRADTNRNQNCDKGYKQDLYDSEVCIDINECIEISNSCHPTQICINKIGSFICECPPGFLSMKSGSPCLDINECNQNMHNCSHNCHNTNGSYKCSCPENFMLSENGQMCILSRMPREKQNSSFSLKLSQSSKLCKEGFHFENGTCLDVDECLTIKDNCNFNQTCLNTRGKYVCLQTACPELYVREQSSGQCVQMCIDFPSHICPGGAVIAQSISYTVITLPFIYENVPFLKLVSYDVFNNPLKNTEFAFVDNSHYNYLFSLETYESNDDNQSGNIYILVKNSNLLKKERIYELKVLAKSYDLDSSTLLYVTQFIVYIYIN